MKICELKIDRHEDRKAVIVSLVTAGYKVHVEERDDPNGKYYQSKNYYVIVEGTNANN